MYTDNTTLRRTPSFRGEAGPMRLDPDSTAELKSPSHAELSNEFSATFARLDRWRTVIASRPAPAQDSDLAGDDKIWPWAPATTLCIVSLGSAREHLHAIRLLVETKQLFPSATSTLARSALMSASVAVWMLEPDQPDERQRRMLSFALEDYRNHLAYGRQVRTTFHANDIHSTAPEQLERMQKRSDEVRQKLEALGGKIEWNMTDTVIPAAMRATVPTERQRAQFESRWRVTSGAAHGFIWPHFGAPGTRVVDPDDRGIGETTVGGSVETLVNDYFTAFHIAAKGWDLFEQRSGWPNLGA